MMPKSKRLPIKSWFLLLCALPGIVHAQPFVSGVPLSCIQSAAHRYGLSVPILAAVLRTEGGRPGTVSPDPNGTFDLGPAQVNTCHLPTLQRYGYSFAALAGDPCANIEAGAWIFARCLSGTGNVLDAAACYNAGSRPWLAWQSGYVSRFAGYLGQPLSTPAFAPHPPRRHRPLLLDATVSIARTGGLL